MEEELLAVAVDDETMVLAVIEEIALEAGVKTVAFTSSETALLFIRENRIDMVFADCRMSQMDGIDFIRELRKISSGIPVVMVTVFDDYTVMADALAAGVTEFIPKPVNPVEALARITSLAKLRRAQLLLENRSAQTESEIGREIISVREREVEELLLLGSAAGFRDEGRPGHCLRVADYAKLLSLKSGYGVEEQDIVYHAALLHDIGKSKACHDLLIKPLPFGDGDISLVSAYALAVSRILDEAKSPYLCAGGEACLSCFERFDGTGYPRGLKGDDIPIVGRIITLADALDLFFPADMLCEDEDVESVMVRVKQRRGSQFDPFLSDIIGRNAESLRSISRLHQAG